MFGWWRYNTFKFKILFMEFLGVKSSFLVFIKTCDLFIKV